MCSWLQSSSPEGWAPLGTPSTVVQDCRCPKGTHARAPPRLPAPLMSYDFKPLLLFSRDPAGNVDAGREARGGTRPFMGLRHQAELASDLNASDTHAWLYSAHRVTRVMLLFKWRK